MSLNYLSIDAALISEVNLIGDIGEDNYAQVMNFGVDILEGKDVYGEVAELAGSLGASPSKINRICTAVSALQWDCAKIVSTSKDLGSMQDMLLQLGLSQAIAGVFCQVFQAQRRRIFKLKNSLGVSELSYHNLAWRLDVELARRNISTTSDPKFLLRLDLVDGSAAPCPPAGSVDASAPAAGAGRAQAQMQMQQYQSVHLQADYAHMKLLQTELQRALDEMSGVHCQRISRYIS